MLRAPRSLLKVNGKALLPMSWETTSNSFYQADTFRCVFPITGSNGLAALGDETVSEVEILVGFPANPGKWDAADLRSVFLGIADDIDIDVAANTVSLSGRDRTGLLIDAKTSEKYQNQTAFQIAQKLAARHGLTAVGKSTGRIVGRYYGAEKGVRLQDSNTEWDLLTWLAKEEDAVCYVQGKELHFEAAPDESKSPIVFTYKPPGNGPMDMNTTAIRVSRTLNLAKDILVEVSSWSPNSKTVVRQTATRKKKGSDGGQVQKYSYSIPNLTAEAARQRAQAILADLSKHELKMAITGPADYPAFIGKTDLIKLTGTGSAWDTTYHPAAISRTYDAAGGYAWSIEAKNHGVESDVTL